MQPIARFSVSPPTKDVEGDIAAMALYAGEGVGHVQAVKPAEDIVLTVPAPGVLSIGGWAKGDSWFEGRIAEVAVYDRALGRKDAESRVKSAK